MPGAGCLLPLLKQLCPSDFNASNGWTDGSLAGYVKKLFYIRKCFFIIVTEAMMSRENIFNALHTGELF